MSDNGTSPISEPTDVPLIGGSRATPKAGKVQVFFNSRQEVISSHRAVGLSKWIGGGPRRVYEVDVAEHPFRLSCELPCKQDTGRFIAAVQLVWRVYDPEEFLRRRIEKPEEELELFVRKQMREIARTFSPRQRDEAELAINSALGADPLALSTGLEICRFNVELELDEAARQRQEELAALDHKTECTMKEQALEELEFSHKERLMPRKMDFWRPIVEGGSREALVSQVADRADDLPIVSRVLRELDSAARDNYLLHFKAMLEADHIDSFDLDEHKKAVLQHLVEDLRGIRAAVPPPPAPKPAELEEGRGGSDDTTGRA